MSAPPARPQAAVGQVADDVPFILLELGGALVVLALLARAAHRVGFSPRCCWAA